MGQWLWVRQLAHVRWWPGEAPAGSRIGWNAVPGRLPVINADSTIGDVRAGKPADDHGGLPA